VILSAMPLTIPVMPPKAIFLGLATEPPFLSLKITEGSVVFIFTIGLN
jgi:hypothetical protein